MCMPLAISTYMYNARHSAGQSRPADSYSRVLWPHYLVPWLHTCLGRHDLIGVLAGQPIRLLSRVLDATGSSSGSSGGAAPAFGWDVEVWHERLLSKAAAGSNNKARPRGAGGGAPWRS